MSIYKGCNYCKHLRFDGTCPAFDPYTIPLEIVSGQIKHTTPMFGQNNLIVYEHCEKSIFQRMMEKEKQPKDR
jgi:hypothetical protein